MLTGSSSGGTAALYATPAVGVVPGPPG